MVSEIKIGVSACLLGDKVRYDGRDKRDPYITDVLGAHVTLVSVCPEAGAGMGVPREPMSLVGDATHPRLVTNESRVDKTEQLLDFCHVRIDTLGRDHVSGFILKRNSPSCGLLGVPVFGDAGKQSGRGLFAAALTTAFPHLPVEEEEGLRDPARRENFVQRIFVYRRWTSFVAANPDLGMLVEFHSREKLVLMAHSIPAYRETGKLVGEGSGMPLSQLVERYGELFLEALRLPRTVKKQVNVLQHVMGYFKRELSGDDKDELASAIAQYHDGLLPVLAPLTLLRHYTGKYDQQYLKGQSYLYPHPAELMLLNHP